MRLSRFALLLVAFIARTANGAAIAPDRFGETIAPFFAPLATERAALAPDGKHVAYTEHRDGTVYVAIKDVDNPTKKTLVAIGDDRVRRKEASGKIRKDTDAVVVDQPSDRPIFGASEKTSARVLYLAWVSSNRLIISSDIPEIVAVDADGKNGRILVDRDAVTAMVVPPPIGGGDFGEAIQVRRAPQVLGLIPGDADHILIRAEGHSLSLVESVFSTFRAHARTGKLTFIDELTFRANSLFGYDRQGRIRISSEADDSERTFTYYNAKRGLGRAQTLAKAVGATEPSLWRVSPKTYLGERSFPLGFEDDGNTLIYASNAGRDTLGIYTYDLQAKRPGRLAIENSKFDLASLDDALSPDDLIFDRYQRKLVGLRYTGIAVNTQWIDPELAAVQASLDASFPLRSVQIWDWDEARTRFLVKASTFSDPGAIYVFERKQKQIVELARFAPALKQEELAPTKPFEFETAAGVRLTGYLTAPRNARINPPPLLLFVHDGPWNRELPGFNPDVQALAAMGFMVAQVNYRGSTGFGRRHREAIVNSPDAAPVADLVATADWIASKQRVDQKRIALFGVGYGGYLALRALELHPDRFRCAVTVDAPTDLGAWLAQSDLETLDLSEGLAGPSEPATAGFEGTPRPSSGRPPRTDFFADLRRFALGNRSNLSAVSALGHAQSITKPVLLIQDADNSGIPGNAHTAMRSKLRAQGVPVETINTTDEFTQRLPKETTKVLQQVYQFFNDQLYNYGVEIGTPRPVK